MTRLVILRGLPGAGKSTYAREHYPDAVVCSADDYMTDAEGRYVFDASRLSECHARALAAGRAAFKARASLIVVDNTNSRWWEWQDWAALGREYGVEREIVDLFDGDLSDEELAARCVHGVPVEAIARMRRGWER